MSGGVCQTGGDSGATNGAFRARLTVWVDRVGGGEALRTPEAKDRSRLLNFPNRDGAFPPSALEPLRGVVEARGTFSIAADSHFEPSTSKTRGHDTPLTITPLASQSYFPRKLHLPKRISSTFQTTPIPRIAPPSIREASRSDGGHLGYVFSRSSGPLWGLGDV